ncbi:hypothetical protein L3X38_043890 [Prunus dulcis]|uniref:Cyclase family protein n=1 Tax=Prunus dulcis TaxID=3755 RepID=A0AAD4UXN6_PRUDU|nr:hypothetical protein L3X38_043890 [Prunus dulcis]
MATLTSDVAYPTVPDDCFLLGEGVPVLVRREAYDNGRIFDISHNVHSGTHVDAPGHVFDHFYDAGFDADTLDLEVLNGPALVVDVHRDKNITAEVMKALNIPKGVRRVLFRTSNTDRNDSYIQRF